jgi:hypothetical protein
MKAMACFVLALSAALSSNGHCESYIPLGQAGEAQYRGKVIPARVEHRPALPGIRPVEVELLEDALRRKMPNKVGDSRQKAHQKILSIDLRDPVKSGQLKGLMAEALFLEKNPNWGYVTKPTAPQVDVYLRREGMRPLGAQIKVHASGNPATYARDMVKDRDANLFLVPDDHVAALRKHLQAQIESYDRTGNTAGAAEARRQYSRVRGLGFTYRYNDDGFARAHRSMTREHYAGYVSLGTAFGLARGIMVFNLADQESLSDTPRELARGASVIAAERLATHLMTRNALRIASTPAAQPGGLVINPVKGTVKGNAIVGATILLVDSSFAIHDGGGIQALHNVNFYSDITASTISFAAAMSAGSVAAEATSNPILGFAVGALVGSGVYIGVKKPAHQLITLLFEERVRLTDDAIYNAAKMNINRRISELKAAAIPGQQRT